MYIKPAGPLEVKQLTDVVLNNFRSCKSKTLNEQLEGFCQKIDPMRKLGRPDEMSNDIWRVIASYPGGEEALLQQGCIQLRALIFRRGSDALCFRLAPPLIEVSRRLLRRLDSERIIRVHIEKSLLYDLKGGFMQDDIASEPAAGRRTKVKELKQLSRRFEELFYKPIQILGISKVYNTLH